MNNAKSTSPAGTASSLISTNVARLAGDTTCGTSSLLSNEAPTWLSICLKHLLHLAVLTNRPFDWELPDAGRAFVRSFAFMPLLLIMLGTAVAIGFDVGIASGQLVFGLMWLIVIIQIAKLLFIACLDLSVPITRALRADFPVLKVNFCSVPPQTPLRPPDR